MNTNQINALAPGDGDSFYDFVLGNIKLLATRVAVLIDAPENSVCTHEVDTLPTIMAQIKYQQERTKDLALLTELLAIKNSTLLYGSRDFERNKIRLQKALDDAGISRVERLLELNSIDGVR